MLFELRWRTSLSTTCLHAAYCQQQGLPTCDDQLAVAIAPAAAQLSAELASFGASDEQVLLELCNLSADYENNRQLAERTLARLKGQTSTSESAKSRLAGHVAGLEAALLRVQPDVADQLAVRGRPLREQWESRGPGLLRALGRMSDPGVVPESAEVVLVSPYVGGHGTAHSRNNRLVCEAVLTNPEPNIPEVVRLAWLLAQLNYDLPSFTDRVSPSRLAVIAPLANLPAALAAGEEVELTRLDEQHVQLALEVWHLPAAKRENAAGTLLQWWEVVQSSNDSWAVALAALDAMLFAD
ncbi:hypothetical protein [Adhaeretor mobilis]|uniref:Uncharacterized protein n=1 Tax=Adhaeretor mobilis TaxID=1930276 RepID=A0A517MRW1_9BACT|nr:hypothetical protein [Adhaeretor mobilis]QDS97622.1 hypothetical protein HG15A2_08860 [Adhaeretor mobilis]